MAYLVPDVANIAILGFAESCPVHNEVIAFNVGKHLAAAGYIVTSGNITSTFHYAFKGAKSVAGRTAAVIEENKQEKKVAYCDVVLHVPDTDAKHKLLVELCEAAIVIGGGDKTKELVRKFQQQGKPVYAVNNTGGVVESELDGSVQYINDIKEIEKWNF